MCRENILQLFSRLNHPNARRQLSFDPVNDSALDSFTKPFPNREASLRQAFAVKHYLVETYCILYQTRTDPLKITRLDKKNAKGELQAKFGRLA